MSALRALALMTSLWLGIGPASAQADVAVPALRARVTDLTGTLAAGEAAALEQKLQAFETAKGSQIAVLILPTTQPETIEQFSIRVAETWKLGRKGVDDGAVLVVAKDDHKLRIEVGYGLEGVLNDAVSKRIISETITPRFRQGDFAGGIDAGVTQMIGLVNGEPLPAPPEARTRADRGGHGNSGVTGLLVPFFILWFLGSVLKRLLGSGFAALAVGGVMGFIAFALLSSLALALIIGFIASVIAFVMYLGGGGGFPVGGFGGGGWGGGGFGGGGGGFSGGGGGFGGGGASGDW